MRIASMLVCVGVLSSALAVGCLKASDDNHSSGSGGSTGSTGSTGTTGAGGDSSTTGAGGSTTGAGGNATTGSGGGGPAASCSQGVLYAGDPRFNGDLEGWNTAGQKLLDDPPLRFEDMDFSGTHFVTDTKYELWAADTSAATPMIARVAGDETDPDERFEAGVPCAQARFLQTAGIAVKSDGTIVVADRIGNGVVEVTDPFGPSCAVKYVAGQSTMISSSDAGVAANPGDVDGPGAQAKFASVTQPVVGPNDEIYVLDNGNAKIKKIANDASRTVSTVASIDDPDGPQWWGLTYLNGKLYASGVTITQDFLVSVDATTGTVTTLIKGANHFDEINGTAGLTSLDNDGQALIATGSGYIWRLGTDGKVLANLAGTGYTIDFPADFDVTMPHPASEWPLMSPSETYVKRHGGDLYWRGENGVGLYVVRLSCP